MDHERSGGQSLIELILALGVFGVVAATSGFLLLTGLLSFEESGKQNAALRFAQEGLEAARAIRNADFDAVTSGPHGIGFVGNQWVFSGTSDGKGGLSRQVVVRDLDIDTKEVKSKVTWQLSPERSRSVVLSEYFTDWEQTQGQGEFLSLDISDAEVAGVKARELRGVKMRNTGTGNITIDKITPSWTGSSLIEEIEIDGRVVWNHNKEGSPDGRQVSGTELDIKDFVLKEGKEVEIDKFQFTKTMTGATFVVKFVMRDQSTTYVVIKP